MMRAALRAVAAVSVLGAPFALARCGAEQPRSLRVIILAGQSNMAGAGVERPRSPENPSRIFVWRSTGWEPAREPVHERNGVGPGLFFADAWADAHPADVIGLVPCAKGATSLGQWVPGGELFETCVARASAAIAAGGELAGLLWNQGESDARRLDRASAWEGRFARLAAAWRARLDAPDLPIVVARLGDEPGGNWPGWQTVRAAHEAAARDPNMGIVDLDGLERSSDVPHYSTMSYRAMGRRFACALERLEARP